MSIDYSNTLNLPKSSFQMRGNLPQREPAFLEEWKKIDLFNIINKKNNDKPVFELHDGPPFSNGNIHMGTAMNKILKDIINKYKMMTGYKVPYIPGWDNHGMPIESAIIKQNKLDRKNMSVPEFRNACKTFAQKYVDIQMNSFKRLGVLADWDHSYTTMAPSFEAREIKVFEKMFEKGYIYKGMKPVYWCPYDETALAEAEIEYQEDDCSSIYVKFKISDDKGLLSSYCDLNKLYFVIWTTTPWTLPGNQAIAINPDEKYSIVDVGGEYYILASELVDKCMEEFGISDYLTICSLPGKSFEFMTAHHPFLNRESLVCCADYVTMDSGTGCVHTAGGFGLDDFNTSKKYNIDVIVPVNDKGYLTDDAGDFSGIRYDKSNQLIIDRLEKDGSLIKIYQFKHQYPHCWRCKNEIIFRATPQWFCSVEKFRDAAVKSCEDVDWIPAWGKERMIQMITDRADWCISRQRHWGLPIPVFYCINCGKEICNEETINYLSGLFEEFGSNIWFEKDAKEILPDNYKCPDCRCDKFSKDLNTLDGWFDSGSTHFSVIEDKEGHNWPADLYLEGADQYRGWFQSSLLCAVGSKNAGAPYKQVLTHGWVVDGKGEAMHKSKGNSIYPEDVIKKYGADIVRLWVASSDYTMDVRCSDVIFGQLSESYRKFRNTCKFFIDNCADFDPDRDFVSIDKMMDIDKWVVSKVNSFVSLAVNSYNTYQFHDICQNLNALCTNQLSKLYIDIIKDRVYVEKANSYERRSAQSAMYYSLSVLSRVMAPILSFTSDEIWREMKHFINDDSLSVFLNDLPFYNGDYSFSEIESKYDRIFELRETVLKALEIARVNKMIGKSLDAKVIISSESELSDFLKDNIKELPSLFIVSQVEIVDSLNDITFETDGIKILVLNAMGNKCARCWTYSVDSILQDDGETYLCPRCSKVLK